MTQILSTTDYNRFKTILGNRKVKKAHVNKLKSAFEWNPAAIEWVPIIINERNEIIDGQHRFEAIRELELPVYYRQIKGLTLEDVQALNSNTKAWTPDDYAIAYATQGNRNYDHYLKFKKRFALNHDIVLQYVAMGNPATTESFKRGNFKSGNQKLAWQYGEYLMDIGKYIPHYKLRATAVSFLRICSMPGYDHARMMEKVKKLGHTVERFTQHEDAIGALLKVYNHGLPENQKVVIPSN